MRIRTGLGFDIHRLTEGRELFLGGVKIPFDKGLLGHSDGDCLLHAAIDALLGAAGERDIGTHFPNTDPAFKNIRSILLLERVADLLRTKSYEVINIDSVVIVEKPLINPYIPEMKSVMSSILGMESDAIGIKAKSNEGMGSIGQGEAIAAWASVLIHKKSK